MSIKLRHLMLPFILLLLSWSPSRLDNNAKAEELKVANQLINLVNDYRSSIGKPLLIRNATADKLANEHSIYMATQQKVSHDNYDKRWDVLELKENAEEVTENLGLDVSADAALKASLKNIWLKANLEGEFTHTGISVKKDANGKFYYTQIFFKK